MTQAPPGSSGVPKGDDLTLTSPPLNHAWGRGRCCVANKTIKGVEKPLCCCLPLHTHIPSPSGGPGQKEGRLFSLSAVDMERLFVRYAGSPREFRCTQRRPFLLDACSLRFCSIPQNGVSISSLAEAQEDRCYCILRVGPTPPLPLQGSAQAGEKVNCQSRMGLRRSG